MNVHDDDNIHIRTANPEDISLIFSLLHQKAAFDRAIGAYAGTLTVSEAKLHHALFRTVPYAYVLLAERRSQVLGFALYGFRYSSFVGQPSIWLDDLFVEANRRSQGAGAALMARLAQIAQEQSCTHLAWTADARNTRGLSFYQRLGATMTAQPNNRCALNWIPWEPAKH